MANKEIVVQLSSPERIFTRCYHDFIDCNLLNGEEKIIFLALKRFLNVKLDSGDVHPTIETIQNMTGWGNQKVIKYINSLKKKGIVKKVRQGLNKPNLYVLSDFPAMWEATNEQEMKKAIEQGQAAIDLQKYSDEELQKEIERRNKEKRLEATAPTKVTADSSLIENNMYVKKNITKNNVCQERYSLEEIQQLYDYDILCQDNQGNEWNIDAVMAVLYDALNTQKETIRIAGENRPAMSVIAKLMKLTYLDISYALEKFSKQTERIDNPAAYLLTILYKSKEQSQLDVTNQVAHDMAKGKAGETNGQKNSRNGNAAAAT